MLDPSAVPDVADDELLARFLMVKGYIRADRTLRHNEFMPPPSGKLSVMRHLDATRDDIWAEGREVARLRAKELLGRADLITGVCRSEGLQVIKSPLQADPASKPEPRRRLANPNHADLIFPTSSSDSPAGAPTKSDQKSIAQRLAARQIKATPAPAVVADDASNADRTTQA